jgi:cell division protein FtsI (penicillin-binding protein 3)
MMFSYHARRNANRIVGERSFAFDLARGRLVLISGVFVLAYILLAARAVDLSLIQGSLNRSADSLAEETQAALPAPYAVRADIRDRNGVLLATTLQTASLYADTQLISEPVASAKALVQIFPDLSYGDVLQKLQSGKRFVWIKRRIMPREQAAVLEIGQPGLGFQAEGQRVYPQGNLAAHLLGFTDVDDHGQAGVERSFDKILSDGHDLTLTLDVRLQHVLRRELQKTMTDFNAAAGAGLIMDVSTGEILAGVSLPDFDPHNPGAAKAEGMFNRMTLGAYELGSVFKIFSTAALLDIKDLPMSATFDAREPLKEGGFTINDYHAEDRVLTIPEVFMYSSNIGAAMMGQAVGTEALRGFYRDLGLLDPLDFEILEVAKPMVPDPWRDIHTLTASYGHGVATTPLQLVSAVSSIVNGGLLVKPRLVIDQPGKTPGANGQGIRIVSADTSKKMRRLMRLVVAEGTGTHAEVAGYNIGGKTGTAEKIDAHGRYDRKKLISSFIGVFPAEQPRYAVFMMVDEPKGNKKSFGYATAGWTAAPAVARVVSAMAAILGIKPQVMAASGDFSASLKRYVSTGEAHHD